MTVINTFQCDICFSPCVMPGSITLLLVKEEDRPEYAIISRLSTLKNMTPKGDQMVRHICQECSASISCEALPAAFPAPWATEADMGDKNNGQTD